MKIITHFRNLLMHKGKWKGRQPAFGAVESNGEIIMIATTDTTLAELAVKHPSASRVFHRHGLDFCCHGNRALEEACHERGLLPEAILNEIETEDSRVTDAPRWERRPLSELASHIVDFYHRRLREELPLLVGMAARVEQVHRDKAACPRGLADHLDRMHRAVLEHLAKEETILFPMIQSGRGARAAAPIHTMEIEHEDHGESLRQTRLLTSNLVPPAEACATWTALYLRLEEFEAELMEHIHLENNILFRRALCE
jgi:regulator of cell morphogenesis and NO signaling